jgi:hypothetical protein
MELRQTVTEKLAAYSEAASVGHVPSQYTCKSFKNICFSGKQVLFCSFAI